MYLIASLLTFVNNARNTELQSGKDMEGLRISIFSFCVHPTHVLYF